MPPQRSTSKLDPRVAEYNTTIRKRYWEVLAQLALNWRTDWSAARLKALSALPGKGSGIIFTYFSGSDWCVPCKELHGEVFDSPTFLHWFHGTKMVPMLVDFPLSAAAQPAATWTQNWELKDHYGVTGYPIVLAIRSSDAKKIAGFGGYVSGTGPDKWIATFSKALGIT